MARSNESRGGSLKRPAKPRADKSVPPPDAPAARPSLLPSTPAVFVGRERELARLEARLCAPAGRVSVGVIDGVPGVGKSALAFAFAALHAERRPEAPHVLYASVRSLPVEAFVDELRRLASPRPLQESLDVSERIRDLAARLDEARGVLVVDDLHELPAADRDRWVGLLAAHVRVSTVVATSRERCKPHGGGDYVEAHLGGLDEAAQAELWARLDDLYGPAQGLEAARARAAGNPFLLRRAHAGDLGVADDPARTAIADLGEDALRIARLLAHHSERIAFSSLVQVIPKERARAAADLLSRRLIIDVDGAATLGLHDLFREPLVEGTSPEASRALHGMLATIALAAPAPEATRLSRWARGAVRHLVAADRHEEACALLVDRAAEMVKVGATRDLLQLLESIPEPKRTSPAQLTRARCLVRMVRVPEALAELRRLSVDPAAPRAETHFSLASTTFMAGNVEEALEGYRALLADPSLPRPLRDSVVMAFAWSTSTAGLAQEGRALLEAAQRTAASADDAALFAFYRAVSHWSDESDEACERALSDAGALDPHAAPPFAVGNLVPPMLAVMLARLGRHQEAKAYRALAIDQEAATGEDLQGKLQSLRLAATFDLEMGDPAGATPRLVEVARAYERGGNIVSALVCRQWLGRSLLAEGKSEEAVVVLDDVANRAQALGLVGIASNVARLRMRATSGGVVLDARTHELRLADKTISLRARPTLSRILYALAKEPQKTHSKEALAQLLWGDRYHPLRHDNAFWVNVRRLRKLLEGTGVSIEHIEEGYRIVVPKGFVLLQ